MLQLLIESLQEPSVEGKDIFIQSGQTEIKDALKNIE